MENGLLCGGERRKRSMAALIERKLESHYPGLRIFKIIIIIHLTDKNTYKLELARILNRH